MFFQDLWRIHGRIQKPSSVMLFDILHCLKFIIKTIWTFGWRCNLHSNYDDDDGDGDWMMGIGMVMGMATGMGMVMVMVKAVLWQHSWVSFSFGYRPQSWGQAGQGLQLETLRSSLYHRRKVRRHEVYPAKYPLGRNTWKQRWGWRWGWQWGWQWCESDGQHIPLLNKSILVLANHIRNCSLNLIKSHDNTCTQRSFMRL